MTHSFPTRRSSDLSNSFGTGGGLIKSTRRLPLARGARGRLSGDALLAAQAPPRRTVPVDGLPAVGPRCRARAEVRTRSEEHTSELQSLMRISYAVFCLKKKK